ncbi:hypothetical protein P5673_014022 [Acropora cervicornis]|uniref:Uncharacterized protein n=1 Tax=Acropora cervicornis TaxID=6130 RepID=A0AAD9QL91_ACRCE|nr:hypothetical protein P5673_014022 [Acropora cervicornis]
MYSLHLHCYCFLSQPRINFTKDSFAIRITVNVHRRVVKYAACRYAAVPLQHFGGSTSHIELISDRNWGCKLFFIPLLILDFPALCPNQESCKQKLGLGPMKIEEQFPLELIK